MRDFEVWSKRHRRQFSEFVASELAYDHVTHRLDDERKKAMAEAISKYQKIQIQIKAIEFGINYSQQLSETMISENFLTELQESSSQLKILRRNLRVNDWSPAVRVGLEVFSVIVIVGLISFFTPWNYLLTRLKWDQSTSITLTEVERPHIESEDEMSVTQVVDDKPLFEDENAKVLQAHKSAEILASDTVKVISPSQEVSGASSPVPDIRPQPTETIAELHQAAEVKPPVKSIEKLPGSGGGFIYRGRIKVSNIDATSPKIKDRIEELGGRKAGEVELGWHKGAGTYFHFTMPEKNYPDLLTLLQEYSNKKVSISKDKHQRVMPDGIIRLILEVEPVTDATSNP